MGDAQAEIQAIREALERAESAIRLTDDRVDAFRDATDLSEVGGTIRSDAGHLRADLAAELKASTGLSMSRLGETLGMKKAGANRLVQVGKKRESAA